MVQIAKEVQDRAPRDPLLPTDAIVESSYSIALDSVSQTPFSLAFIMVTTMPKGTARGDFSGHCGVAEEDTRWSNSLRVSLT